MVRENDTKKVPVMEEVINSAGEKEVGLVKLPVRFTLIMLDEASLIRDYQPDYINIIIDGLCFPKVMVNIFHCWFICLHNNMTRSVH